MHKIDCVSGQILISDVSRLTHITTAAVMPEEAKQTTQHPPVASCVMARLLLSLGMGLATSAAAFENMNGEYVISKTPNAGGAKCELLPPTSVSVSICKRIPCHVLPI